MKIIIKAKSGNGYKDEQELTKSELIIFDGVKCKDKFSEYFHDKILEENVTGGYMDFRFENGCLHTYTEYDTSKHLTQKELEILGDYTQGQWSDGIGEGFEQFPCIFKNGNGYYISAWYPNQKIEIIQITREEKLKRILK